MVSPEIDSTTFVHPFACVIGNVILKGQIMVAPSASVRGDEGQPIYVCEGANIQDGVVLHALETEEEAEYLEKRRFNAEGAWVEPDDPNGFAILIGKNVSLAHQSQVHGPGFIGDHTFIGMQSLIFNAKVGSHSVVEPGCTIIGVEIGDHVYVPAGSIITNQSEADIYNAFTLGFWKNHYPGNPSGHNAWQYTGFDTDQMLGDVFNFLSCDPAVNALFDVTLLEALSFQGGNGTSGAANILLRDAVASLLNASYHETRNGDIYGHDGALNFPYYSTYIADLVNAAIMSCDRQAMLSLADDLSHINNGLEDITWETKEPKPPKEPKGLSIASMAILTGNYGQLYSSYLIPPRTTNQWLATGSGISNTGMTFLTNRGWQSNTIPQLSQLSPWTNSGGPLWYQNGLDWFKMTPAGPWWWQSSLGITSVGPSWFQNNLGGPAWYQNIKNGPWWNSMLTK
ncbi:MAG: hypothetical protein ACMUIU_07925 [bacterium]